MNAPFLIRNPETRAEYELNDVGFFQREYAPKGFRVVDPAPMGYTVPELPKTKPVHAEPVKVAKPKTDD